MPMSILRKHIVAVPDEKNKARKVTKTWIVYSTAPRTPLGAIAWNPSLEKYSFSLFIGSKIGTKEIKEIAWLCVEETDKLKSYRKPSL